MNSWGHRSVFVAALVLALLSLTLSRPRDDGATSRLHLLDNTWTDECGTPGNSIHIYSVRAATPKNYVGLECYEGRIDFKRTFGEEEIRTSWNYGSFDPIVLNVLIPEKNIHMAAVKIIDDDHLLIRFLGKLPEMPGEDVFRHPDTRRLTRQR